MQLSVKLNIVLLLLTYATLKARVCSACLHGEVRLVNVTGEYQGTVKVCYAGRWSGVCADDRYSNQKVAIICRQLGCDHGVMQQIHYLCNATKVGLFCEGNELEILNCSFLNSEDCSSNHCISLHCNSCKARSDLLPYGDLLNDLHVPKSDDGSTDEVILTQPFPFFRKRQTRLYVNINGLMSFNQSYTDFSPQPLPLRNIATLILPFWIDIDITCQGAIYYRQTTSSEILEQAKLLLYDYKPASIFNPTSVFVTTWHNVRPYVCSLSALISNTFQTVLLTDGQISFACLLYEDIQWGSRAQIGFNAGDGNRSFTSPFGLTDETLNMDHLSNINGRKGVFIYRVDDKDILSPETQIESPTQVLLENIATTMVKLRWTSEASKHIVYCYHRNCYYCLPLHIFETANTSVTVNGLIPHTEYRCCVTLLVSGYESDCSDEIAFSTLSVPPTAPIDVAVIKVTTTSVHLSWYGPQYTNGTINYYTIRCAQNVWFSNTSQILAELQPFTNYSCCVSASNQAGEGSRACITVVTLPAAPSSPVNLTFVSIDVKSITLQWRKPANTYGQNILHYIVSCRADTNDALVISKVNTLIARVSSLNLNTNYTCCVFAVSSQGNGSSTCILSIKTLERSSLLLIATTISGGLIAVLMLVITCCCIWKRKCMPRESHQMSTKLREVPGLPCNELELKEQQSSAAPMTSTVQIEIKTSTANKTNILPTHQHQSIHKGSKDTRYQRPILMPPDTRIATGRKYAHDQKLPKKLLDQNKQHLRQQTNEQNYQPLILPKRSINPSVSTEYEDLTFKTREPKIQLQNKLLVPASNSEVQYDVVKTEEANQYDPMTFDDSPQAEAVYEIVADRDEDVLYENVRNVHMHNI